MEGAVVRGLRAAAPACLLVLVAMSGCATEAGEDGDDEGSLKTDIVDGGPSTKAGKEDAVATTGRVEGVVLHASGFALSDAQVTILSVDSSVTTGRDGGFAFDKVGAGEQVLRVEKETYKTLQKPFEVVAGKVSKVEVVLRPVDEGGFAEHTHNHWRGSDTFTVFQDTLKFADDISEVPPGCVWLLKSLCTWMYIEPEEEHIVPPGTSKVVIDLEFEPGPFFEDGETMTFYIYPPPDAEGDYHSRNHQVTSGSETIEYELPGPAMYDHGHARWTDWRFQIYWTAGYGNYAGAYYNNLFRSPIDVTITAHKGELELDPPHERYWADGDRLSMEVSEPSSACTSTVASRTTFCGIRNPNYNPSTKDGVTTCNYGCMGLRNGDTVPPGTTRVEFKVEHYWGDEATMQETRPLYEEDDFIIGYKSAKAPPKRATWDDYTWLEPKETTEEDDRVVWTYELDVAEDEADPFYQKITQWVLWPAVRGYEDASNWDDMECVIDACGRAYFNLLEFTAINDDWDELADGA